MRKHPKRGDVFFMDCGEIIGSEQRGIRPVVIIQNNLGNRYSPITIVAMITTAKKREMPVHVRIHHPAMRKYSKVLLEQVRTVSVSRLGKYVCTLNRADMRNIDTALKISFGLY